ncbi:hypothetical protein ACXHPP_16245, partial [Vibrio cincinnatiensis]
MIKYHLPALLLALSPFWVSASVSAEEMTQVDPVAAIDEKISIKQNEIENIASEFETEGIKLQQLKNLITTNFKLTKESIMAILFTKEEAMKDLP